MRPVLVGVLACLFGVSTQAQVPPTPTGSVRDGVYVIEQAQRGATLYAKYCATCHADDLLGGVHPKSVDRIRVVPALRGGEFIAKYTKMRLGDLFVRTRTSMPQDSPGSLSRSQNADILAFLLQMNGYPPGDNELRQNDDAWQNAILIEP